MKSSTPFLLGLVLGACGAPGSRSPPPSSAPATEATASETTAPERAASRAGEACEGPPFSPSDCAEGLVCAPAPGGYCTAPCFADAACPAGTVCTETVRAGRFCFASCERDEDCRADEGYRCDQAWRTCFLPGWATPRPRACRAELPGAGPWAARAVGRAGSSRYQIEPAAALLPDGGVAVAAMAMGTMSEPSRIVTTVVAPDGAVSAPQVLETGKVQHFDPWMAGGPDGRLHLVWLGHDGRGDRNAVIGYSQSTDGVRWTEPVAVHDADVDCPGNEPGCLDKPMIAVAPAGAAHEGRVYLTYSGMGDDGSLRLRRSDDGGRTFGPSTRLGDGTYGDLHVDSRGRVHVAYVRDADGADRFGDAAARVIYLVSDDGGDSFEESVVSAEGEPIPFYFSNPSLAVGPRHRYVAYPSGTRDGAWRLVLAVSRDGRTWTRTEIPGAACDHRMTPTIAASPRGVELIWAEGGGGRGAMVSSRCAAGGTRCEAPVRIGEPFEVYSLVRHDAHWRGEYDALVVDERRRRVHAVFTRPVRDGGDVASGIVHASRPL